MKRGFLLQTEESKEDEWGALKDERSLNSSWQFSTEPNGLPPGHEVENPDDIIEEERHYQESWGAGSTDHGLEEYIPEGITLVSGEDWNLPPGIKNKPHCDKKARTNDEVGSVAEETPMENTEEAAFDGNAGSLQPLAGAPFLPTSMEGSPKLALNSLYGKFMTDTPITDDAYFCWDDDGPSHDRWFTCALLCPATYELFPSGRHDSVSGTRYKSDGEGTIWYRRKKEAAQGAAALRYDCWYYREWIKRNPDAPKKLLWGLDEPYEQHDGPAMSPPPQVQEQIHIRTERWKAAAAVRAGKLQEEILASAMEAEEAVEALHEREAFREIRMIDT